MVEEPKQNSQISSQAEQQAKPPTSTTNAGVVVAWIGIVLCGISLGIYVVCICCWLIVTLRNYKDPFSYFGEAVGYFFQILAPYVGLQYMRLIKYLAKTGRWTTGACVVAVIAIYLLANLLVILIELLEIFIGSLPIGELGLWDISLVSSFVAICVGVCSMPLVGFIVLIGTVGLLSYLIVTGLAYLLLRICERYDYVEVEFLYSNIVLFPYFHFVKARAQ